MNEDAATAGNRPPSFGPLFALGVSLLVAGVVLFYYFLGVFSITTARSISEWQSGIVLGGVSTLAGTGLMVAGLTLGAPVSNSRTSALGRLFYYPLSLLSVVVVTPLLGRVRNPPWHLYGGLDVDAQVIGYLIAVANFIVSFAFMRLRADRRLLMIGLTTLWGFIAIAFAVYYLVSLSFPDTEGRMWRL